MGFLSSVLGGIGTFLVALLVVLLVLLALVFCRIKALPIGMNSKWL